MPPKRDTLLDFFDDFAPSRADFLVYDDGYRTWRYSYADLARAAHAFAGRLEDAGIHKEDKVIFWSENRPEWVLALWGCLLAGIIVVPIDYRASLDLLRKILHIVEAKLVLVGADVTLVPETPPQAPADVDGTPVWRLAEIDWHDTRRPPGEPGVKVARDDLAEIIFTSGATAEPKGVTITHRNILANIVPVENEVRKYRRLGRPFFPLRFLNLLPLSHMFGQAMATFIPPMLPGTTVFMRGYNPAEIVRQIKMRRISVLVCVPKILDVLREHVLRAMPETADAARQPRHLAARWWQYRTVHRMFGLKFWSFVVGAAPLDPELEGFWSSLGFVVIQGYGLTETAPIVSLNHPFAARKGSVGKALSGVEVKIADDGEILVRGENVTHGYYRADAETERAFGEDGWFHTGDIGEMDEEGRLFVRGRKKEMIVTPEGLNVFPDDVEREVNEVAGVKESAVVGVRQDGEERVHAVIVLGPGGDPDRVAREANRRLADHQKIRSVSVWPGGALPRTEGTGKLKRRQIKDWVEVGRPPQEAPREADTIEGLIRKYTGRGGVSPDTTLDELGLTSLERVELMAALEDTFQTSLDEDAFSEARKVDEIRQLVSRLRPPEARRAEPIAFPGWNRRRAARWLRAASLSGWILPLARVFARVRVEGREHLPSLEGPVIFAANHQSHFDTPAILAALPPRWRHRVAPAMSKEFFDAHFFPERHGTRAWLTNSVNYYLAALFFGAFPLPQREAGARQALRHIGDLASGGHSILIFPEGRHSATGEIGPFRPGVGMMAARLALPVVPVRVDGTNRVLPPGARMARPARVRVAFGEPLRLTGEDYPGLARQVEVAVRGL